MLGHIAVKIGMDITRFKQSMDKVQNNLSGMSQRLNSLAPAMDKIGRGLAIVGTAAAAGFGAMIVGSVKGASSLEGYRNTLNVVMKDQEKAAKTMAWAVDFANRTPFETDSVIEATVRLQAYGLQAQKVLPAIGDMAGVMNKDVMQAVEAVADAQTGELERLKEFGITKGMIIEQGNKIMRGVELVNNKGQITDQENFNKALFSLMQERFQGGMEMQASSFKGLWSTIKGVFSTTLATMAGISATGEVKIGGFFDTVKQKMQGVIDKLADWQASGQLEEWAGKAQEAFAKFWAVTEKVLKGLAVAGRFIAENWDIVASILAGVMAGFLYFKVATTVVSGLTIAVALLNGTMALNPIAGVTMLIMGLAAAGVYLYRNWDEVRAKLSATWELIGAAADGVATRVAQVWQGLKKRIGEVLLGLMEQIAPFVSWMPGALGRAFSELKDQIGSELIAIDETLEDLRKTAVQKTERIGAAWDGLRGNMQDPIVVPTADLSKLNDLDDLSDLVRKPLSKKTEGAARSAGKDARAPWEIAFDRLNIASEILQTKFETVTATMSGVGQESSRLGEQLKFQQVELVNTADRIEVLRGQYNVMRSAKGELAEETQKAYLLLVKEEKAYKDLEVQIEETTEAQQDWRRSLAQLSAASEILQAKYELNIARMVDTTSTGERLRVELGNLQEQLVNARERVGILSDEYSRLKSSQEATTEQIDQLLLQLLREQKIQADLEGQIRDTTKEMNGQTEALLKQREALIDLGKTAEQAYQSAFGDALLAVSKGIITVEQAKTHASSVAREIGGKESPQALEASLRNTYYSASQQTIEHMYRTLYGTEAPSRIDKVEINLNGVVDPVAVGQIVKDTVRDLVLGGDE